MTRPAPTAASAKLTRSTGTRPKRSSSPVPAIRPSVMKVRKVAKASTPAHGRQLVALDERHREPVVGGALGERRREHDQADEQGARLEPGRAVPLAGRRRPPRGARWSAGRKRGRAHQARTTVTTEAPRKCTVSGTPAQDIAEPTSAETTVPPLKAAWKCGITEVPRWRSTSAPSRFIETSQMPTPRPTRNSPAATPQRGPWASTTSPTASRPDEPDGQCRARPPGWRRSGR